MQKIIEFLLSFFQGSSNTEYKEIKMSKKLCEDDFIKASELLDCETACIKAVLSVETGNRGGFLLNKDINENSDNPTDYSDYPVILFEGHIFYKQLKKKGLDPDKFINTDTTDIIYPKWTKQYYSTKWGEYMRLHKASDIDNECALLSTSYGLGQIMGFNYKACGYDTVFDFVEDMKVSEGQQLLAFCNFIKSNPKILKALQTKDWVTFAYNYNGPDYKKNNYDIKLEKAYTNAYK